MLGAWGTGAWGTGDWGTGDWGTGGWGTGGWGTGGWPMPYTSTIALRMASARASKTARVSPLSVAQTR